jgi:Arc/MetJ-type ribon-helix-helix transcriptional regulator
MSVQIPVRIAEEDLSELDAAIARGSYPNRSAALRAALALLLREEREREIVEAYRRGYGEHPQEEEIGETGLALWAERIRSEGREDEPL